MHSFEFWREVVKNYLVAHVRTAATDIHFGISLRKNILCEVYNEGMHSFLQHFGIYSFQIDFRILQKLRGVFRAISNIYDPEMLRYRFLARF